MKERFNYDLNSVTLPKGVSYIIIFLMDSDLLVEEETHCIAGFGW